MTTTTTKTTSERVFSNECSRVPLRLSQPAAHPPLSNYPERIRSDSCSGRFSLTKSSSSAEYARSSNVHTSNECLLPSILLASSSVQEVDILFVMELVDSFLGVSSCELRMACTALLSRPSEAKTVCTVSFARGSRAIVKQRSNRSVSRFVVRWSAGCC